MELNTREEIRELVKSDLEKTLVTVYDSNSVTTGDITPHQHLRWEELIEKTTDLFMELLNQNKGIEVEG